MLTALMGPFLALHLLTVNAFHEGIQTSMQLTMIYTKHGAVYVHEDWRDSPQSPVAQQSTGEQETAG